MKTIVTEEGRAFLNAHAEVPSSVQVDVTIRVLDHSGEELWTVTPEVNPQTILYGDTITVEYKYKPVVS